jgi:hypothetical protein
MLTLIRTNSTQCLTEFTGTAELFYVLTELISHLTTLQILKRCNCGTYFIIFHCACAWIFLCFSIWYRWTLLVLYAFLLCCPLNVCDHEVTVVKNWRTSTCFKLFFRLLQWYVTTEPRGQCERLSRRLV